MTDAHRIRRRLFAALLALGLLAAACGGGGDDTESSSETTAAPETSEASSDTTAAPATTAAPTTTAAPEEFDIASIEQSVVKIAAEGSFIDPEVGLQTNVAGVGTGFVIDGTGLVVTNNHVVTGAATIEVFLAGQEEPVNARLLGVSECSDLAVIDLDGDGYAPLSFYEGEVRPGLDVFAAGYPLTLESTIEAVDYTLTRGIVSSVDADGESNWASVESVIEHDARIRGGNSGGPLVDENGQVVAINYAGFAEADQNFAITADEARAIIKTLSAGEDVDSLGVNGQAIFDSASGISGIWVSSVAAGTPASAAGVQAGDIITRLQGLSLATDGTMADYCDVIRTHGADSALSIEVLRYATEEVLEGELNGQPLVQSFSFATELDDTVSDDGSSGGDYINYVTITDDSGAISVEVPAEWVGTDGRPNEEFGPSIYAAPDLAGFLETWDVPGVIVEASTSLGPADVDSVLDGFTPQACVGNGRQPYDDGLYTGVFEVFGECGGTDTLVLSVAAAPPEGGFVVRVFIQVIGERDLAAADRILNSFFVN